MDEILLTDATERYLRGEMDDAEKALFEQLRRTNTEVDQFVVEHHFFLQQLAQFGDTRTLKNTLQDVHQHLLETGTITDKQARGAKVVNLWRKYKRTIAVAASIAGVVSLLTIGVVSTVSDPATNSQVRDLVGKIQKTDRDVNTLKEAIGKTTSPSAPIEANFNGTSFLIDGKGYLVTNKHVVRDNKIVYVSNGKSGDLRAEVVYANGASDIAILKITDERFKPIAALPYAIRRTNVDLGEQIFTLGYPRQEIVYNEGYLSAKTGFSGDTSRCQIAISANPGNSGGPVINSSGEVIGILSSKEDHADNVVFAVKSNNIFRALAEIKKDTALNSIKLPARSSINGLNRVQQIKKIEDCVFMVKVK
jgi:S1-C subfamily serine protease